MRYLIVDAMLSGTGLRDTYSGEYYSPACLGLSKELQEALSDWLQSYHQEHFRDFSNDPLVQSLDLSGISICRKLIAEKPELKVEYYSAALGKRIYFS